MLAKLEMKLDQKEGMTSQMSSSMHGALMELLPEEYAQRLHESRLHPYTQHLELRNGDWYWVVTALNEEASEKILEKTLMPLKEIYLKKKDRTLVITDKSYQELSDRELAFSFYRKEASKYLNLSFVTPTAFKQNGKYVFYPDIRSIYVNLMNKYDACSEQDAMRDEDMIEQLAENTEIIRYDLKSIPFCLESVKIPAFVGKVTFRFKATQTMANFANMLFQFGAYSGIGIKTSLGMGAIRILEGGSKKDEG